MDYYIVYLSSATALYTPSELDQILRSSRKNNAALNITGILLYADGNIIQVLEGEESTVKKLYAAILQDPRHKGVIALAEGPLEERNFPDWSMGFQETSLEQFDRVKAHPALTILKVFYTNNQKYL